MTNFDYRNTEYLELLHAIQSGVKATIELGISNEATPKHLRTGINSALINISALGQTLIEKGIITFEEWRDNEIKLLEQEVKDYENNLSKAIGKKIRLQ